MDAGQELVERILLNREDVGSILAEYKITKIRDEKHTIEKWVERFINAKRIDGLSPETLKNYQYTLDIFATRTSKEVPDITTDDIREHIVFLGKIKKLKETSLQNKINILKSFFGWLHIEEIIAKNPILKIRPIKLNAICTRQGLTIEQTERLKESCKFIREKAMIEFLLSSGCRVSEAVNINLDSINWRDRSLIVIGKGDKARTVYFSVRARMMMEEYIKQRKGGAMLFVSDKSPFNPLFTRGIQEIVKTVGDRAGLNISPHVLRHTFATHLLNKNMDITIIQRLLGHEDISTTQIYAKIDQALVKQQYDKYAA